MAMPFEHDAIWEIGRLVAEFRARQGTGQTQLAQEVLKKSRTAIANLEEGRKLPKPDELREICEALKIPAKEYLAAAHPMYLEVYAFQRFLSEFMGKPVSLRHLDAPSVELAVDRIAELLKGGFSTEQAHAAFNSVLTFFGEKYVSRAFFEHFLGATSLSGFGPLKDALRNYQAVALRLYGNFRRAWKSLAYCDNLEEKLRPLLPISQIKYTDRREFQSVNTVDASRLDDLGYISAEHASKQNKEREELSRKLKHFAEDLRAHGTQALGQMPDARLRRLRRLLGVYAPKLDLETTLFSEPDPNLVEAEAQRIQPDNERIQEILRTRAQGERNLSVYLTEPYIDVYVATSMRVHADFVSVNEFVNRLFSHERVRQLKLRYFNPTQSWIADRVAKGLVEALMLRRASLTIYMAQKGDTFGKDSEASVALGQGKPVIVYAPKLSAPQFAIDSEELFSHNAAKLKSIADHLGIEDEEEREKVEVIERILTEQLARLTDTQLRDVVADHWADFDLVAELKKTRHEAVIGKIEAYIGRINFDDTPSIDTDVRDAVCFALVSASIAFEKRASTFRDVHPLSLQVIISTGVLNGILVVRSVDQCAVIIHQLLTNTLDTEVIEDDTNYKLVEKKTRSTLRVISKMSILSYAFWTQYFDDNLATV